VSISPIFYEQLLRTKVFCTAFLCLQFGFEIFWQKDFGVKAAHKMLVKLTPGWQQIGQQIGSNQGSGRQHSSHFHRHNFASVNAS